MLVEMLSKLVSSALLIEETNYSKTKQMFSFEKKEQTVKTGSK